jgi:CBS domain containing-hemolysin-like protein
MEDVPLTWELAALALLLVMSGFFSIAETSMMALNRYRLRHLVAQGHGGAKRAAALLRHTDRLLGAILIGNNVVNAAAATLASVIAVELVGQGRVAYASARSASPSSSSSSRRSRRRSSARPIPSASRCRSPTCSGRCSACCSPRSGS